MRHHPHLYLPDPWSGDTIAANPEMKRHVSKVLRYSNGDPVTYTDGCGTVGDGIWQDGVIVRGDERASSKPMRIVTLAVAPPKAKDRQRIIVEKAQELGVASLIWLQTDFGEGRAVNQEKADAWAIQALEQSRGAWLMRIADGQRIDDVDDAVVLDPEAVALFDAHSLSGTVTVAIGPEGGFSERELAAVSATVSLPTNILRTDTAVIAVCSLALASGR